MALLAGKVAVVTGGTTGMGGAMVKRFSAEGATVIATGTNPETLRQAEAEMPTVEFVASDAGDPAAARALIAAIEEKHGRIDVFVANAGTAGYVPFGQVEEEFYDRLFDLNARGAFFLVQEAARIMPDGGSIILISSMAHAMATPNNAVYAASKAAVRSFGRSIASELASRNIRVNTISPGPVLTPIWTKITGNTDERLDAMEEQIAARVPLRRVGQPEDIAAAALFLASDQSTFITGADLPVDGGLVALGFVG